MQIKKIKTFILCLCCLLLFGCSQNRSSKYEGSETQLLGPVAGDSVAVIKTSEGTIKAVLYPQYAPVAVDNFVALASSGYYDGLSFHRIVQNFIVQTGDPTGTGAGGESKWGIPFAVELSDKLHNYSGALGMAKNKSGTNASQFYIVQTPPNSVNKDLANQLADAGFREGVISAYQTVGGAPYLDYGSTVFGQVYEGMGVIDKIAHTKTDEQNHPKNSVAVIKITIEQHEESTK